MKRVVITSILALGVAAALHTVGEAMTDCQVGPNQVAVFQHADWRGSCNILNLDADRKPTGYIDVPWRDLTLGNDSISSVKLGPGIAYVTLFQHSFYAGNHFHFTWSAKHLGYMNDRTSSLRITPPERDCLIRNDGSLLPLRRGEIAIYEDSFYRGDCLQWRSSDDLGDGDGPGRVPTTFDAGFELSSASSIRVGPNTDVVLCERPFYGGYCESFNANVPQLSRTQFRNDALDSFIVQ